MKNKKLLFISNGFYPKARGAEIQMEYLARNFQKNGNEIEVLTLKYDNSLKSYENINGLNIHRISYPKIKGFGTLFYLFSFTLVLWKKIKNWDVLYVVIPEYLAFITALLGKVYKKKVVLKFTGIGDLGAGYINKLFLPKLLFWGIKKADFFIAVSNEMASDILSFGFERHRIKLIPNAVNTKLFMPVEEKVKKQKRKELGLDTLFTAVFVGKLIDFKGVGYLVEAWKLFVEKNNNPSATLLLAGIGPMQEELQNFISENKLKNRIKLLGLRKDIPHLMAQSDLFILPSYTEGLSNTLLEAMSCGLPVVCTKISGNIDLVEDSKNGFLYEAGDKTTLANKISEVFNNQEMAAKLGKEARETILNYCSPEIVNKKYLEII